MLVFIRLRDPDKTDMSWFLMSTRKSPSWKKNRLSYFFLGAKESVAAGDSVTPVKLLGDDVPTAHRHYY